MTRQPDLLQQAAHAEGERRTKHHRFLSFSTKEGRYHRNDIQRFTNITDHGDVKLIVNAQESLLNKTVGLFPEYQVYSAPLEGCPRHLFNYLLFHDLNLHTGMYRWNMQTIANFQTYLEHIGIKRYTPLTIRKAHRTLVDQNITQSTNRTRYMMNPMIFASTNQQRRRELINIYSKNLLANKKDTTLAFLPMYEHSDSKAA